MDSEENYECINLTSTENYVCINASENDKTELHYMDYTGYAVKTGQTL